MMITLILLQLALVTQSASQRVGVKNETRIQILGVLFLN